MCQNEEQNKKLTDIAPHRPNPEARCGHKRDAFLQSLFIMKENGLKNLRYLPRFLVVFALTFAVFRRPVVCIGLGGFLTE